MRVLLCVCSIRALNSFNPFVVLRLQNAQNLSLSLLSLFSRAVSSNTNDTNNSNSKRSSSSRSPLLLLSLSFFPIIYTRNEYKNNTNGEIVSLSDPLQHAPEYE